MKKVLLLGGGAREHAIAEALTRNGGVELFAYAKAKNPGIAALSVGYELGALNDFDHIVQYALKVKPDFAFIGPDDPIGDGVADLLLEHNIYSVAPLKTVARLESSKSFTRDLVKKYNIPGNPTFRVFTSDEGIEDFMNELGGNYVVKADGLMGGKGVKVSGEHLATIADGVAYAKECLAGAGCVVVEEKFIGVEFSYMSFVDGKHVVDMPPVQDHKRAFVGDMGPNTGGMGTYSDINGTLPFLTQKDLDDAHAITQKVADALLAETGTPFKGIMYGGFIAVKDGVKLIEYNARFGDPESLNVLPLLKTDFVEICEAIIHGTLDTIKVEFDSHATVCKYLVPEGYPDAPRKGEKIVISSGVTEKSNLRMYYSSVDQKEDGLYLSSSRAIAFVGIANSLADAEELAEKACANVSGPVFHREDIGTSQLVQKRIDFMKNLRK